VTRHFSQFLFAPYGDGEGLRAVEARTADDAPAVEEAALPAADPRGAVDAAAGAAGEAAAHAERAALLAEVYGWPHRAV
jgi:hypothetical protein